MAIISKIVAFFMSIIMFICPSLNIPENNFDKESMTTDYTYVFVHGLSGWGEYDFYYKLFPYWGVLGGDLMTYLRSRGIDAHGASVGKTTSAWDRACELYAQLTGTVVDYGKEHSERAKHSRYGTDYTGKALIDSFSSEDKINILGHSFGGATVLTFVELMANGSETEREATDPAELSGLFTGGKADWIYSVTTLAAPLNGTTAYEIDTENGKLDVEMTGDFFNTASAAPNDGRADFDTAAYDMHIDNAMRLLEGIETLENVYYFSVPCCMTDLDENGFYVPDTDHMETIFHVSSREMGKYTGTTAGGYVIDEKWLPNDGLVNTISARAPFNAPQKDYDENSVQTGIWNIMPTYRGDHMSLEGGLLKTNNVRQLYVDLINIINNL
ncbi:MAG: hypothetical protein J1E34_02175 [Oscillospiraceae bacterium]|nr:hypothetical protein [Oscillospiraceae bacterium]